MYRRTNIETCIVPVTIVGIFLMVGLLTTMWVNLASSTVHKPTEAVTRTLHKTIDIDSVEIFYREAGPNDAPTILLLLGFPTSPHMFRNLIISLSDRYHLVAPDYPGFGNSVQTSMEEFDYTFDNLANVIEKFVASIGVKKYSIYLMDYSAPIGFRLAVNHPEQVTALIVQNGNAYTEGLREFWDPNSYLLE